MTVISEEFCSILVEKGILKSECEINVNYKGMDLSGSTYLKYNGVFTINDILQKEDKIEFIVASVDDGWKRCISGADITKIDGMDIDRIAHVYGLQPNSKKRKKSRRRSSAEIACEAAKTKKKNIDLAEFDILFH